MWKHYLRLGENEIGNSARAVGYARTAECGAFWLKGDFGAGLRAALGDTVYDAEYIQTAPWYDPRDPATERFYGAYIASITNLSDSTRIASITEGILSGGRTNTPRDTSRETRVRLILTGEGMDALEAGLAWLKGALAQRSCSTHSDGCGGTDATFFVAAPPEQGGTSDADYALEVSRLTRKFHEVTSISGPYIVEEYVTANKQVHGYLVEFTLGADVPWIFSETREVPIAAIATTLVQDVPHNLTPYPSVELGSGSVVIARNLATNPSVETDAVGWSTSAVAVVGAAPSLVAGRDTEIAADGDASFSARVFGDSGTTVTGNRATVSIFQEVDLASVAASSRISFSVWAAMFIHAGTGGSALHDVTVEAEWRNGTTILSTTPVGFSAAAGDFEGRVYSLKSQVKPASATNVRLYVRFDVGWSSSTNASNNSNIGMYVDALAVTVP